MTTQNTETGSIPAYNPGTTDCGHLLDSEVDRALQDANFASQNSELETKVRSIMHDWEGQFPFPEPEDAGLEAEIAFSTSKKLVALINSEVVQVLDRLEETKITLTSDQSGIPFEYQGEPLKLGVVSVSAIVAEKSRYATE